MDTPIRRCLGLARVPGRWKEGEEGVFVGVEERVEGGDWIWIAGAVVRGTCRLFILETVLWVLLWLWFSLNLDFS